MDLQIGFANGILRGNDHTEYFYGMIDDVRLYSRVRRGEIRGARRPRPCHYLAPLHSRGAAAHRQSAYIRGDTHRRPRFSFPR
jgi:hypothetical protein